MKTIEKIPIFHIWGGKLKNLYIFQVECIWKYGIKKEKFCDLLVEVEPKKLYFLHKWDTFPYFTFHISLFHPFSVSRERVETFFTFSPHLNIVKIIKQLFFMKVLFVSPKNRWRWKIWWNEENYSCPFSHKIILWKNAHTFSQKIKWNSEMWNARLWKVYSLF